MLLMPYRPSDGQKTNTNATFDAAYFFKEDKEKTCVEISVFYALNPEGAFPPAVNVPMAKPFLGTPLFIEYPIYLPDSHSRWNICLERANIERW